MVSVSGHRGGERLLTMPAVAGDRLPKGGSQTHSRGSMAKQACHASRRGSAPARHSHLAAMPLPIGVNGSGTVGGMKPRVQVWNSADIWATASAASPSSKTWGGERKAGALLLRAHAAAVRGQTGLCGVFSQELLRSRPLGSSVHMRGYRSTGKRPESRSGSKPCGPQPAWLTSTSNVKRFMTSYAGRGDGYDASSARWRRAFEGKGMGGERAGWVCETCRLQGGWEWADWARSIPDLTSDMLVLTLDQASPHSTETRLPKAAHRLLYGRHLGGHRVGAEEGQHQRARPLVRLWIRHQRHPVRADELDCARRGGSRGRGTWQARTAATALHLPCGGMHACVHACVRSRMPPCSPL
jgi:hypothetical protein